MSNDKREKVDIKYQIPSATPTVTGVFLRFHMWSRPPFFFLSCKLH